MKSPVGWCLVLGLLAMGPGLSSGQETDDGAYELADTIFGGEPEEGFRFQADVLIWNRSNSGSSGAVIGGPESFSMSPLSNSYVGGYRLGGAWLIDPNYEVEGVWTWFSDWNANGGGILSRAVAFNGGEASPLVDPSGNANFINQGTFFRPVFDAAMDPLANPTIQNYAFLTGGSTYSLYSTSTLYDTQVNFKSRRNCERRFAFGAGYRNIRLSEGTGTQINGTFGTNDLPGGGTTNNILTNDALTAHGLTLVSGAGDGWTNTPGNPTTLSFLSNGATTNQLNGAQATLDASLYEKGGFALEGVCRAGVFFNHISGSVRELYAGGGADDSVYGRAFSDSRDVVSFVGNLGLNGVFQLNNNFRIRTGYEIMYLTNQALAGNQQSGIAYNSLGTATYNVQGGSTVFLHGLRAGVEFVW
jgi:hypothetical protein